MSDTSGQSRAWKLEALGRLAEGLAHEVNNVLQDFVSNVELAMDDLPAGSAGYDHADRAIGVALQAASLTDRVAMFSREPDSTEDLTAMLAGLCDLLQRTAGNATTVTLAILSPLPAAPNDLDQLPAALVHLVLDTVQVMRRGGTVRITAAPLDDGGVVIAVAALGATNGQPRLHPLVQQVGGRISPARAADETLRTEIRISHRPGRDISDQDRSG